MGRELLLIELTGWVVYWYITCAEWYAEYRELHPNKPATLAELLELAIVAAVIAVFWPIRLLRECGRYMGWITYVRDVTED